MPPEMELESVSNLHFLNSQEGYFAIWAPLACLQVFDQFSMAATVGAGRQMLLDENRVRFRSAERPQAAWFGYGDGYWLSLPHTPFSGMRWISLFQSLLQFSQSVMQARAHRTFTDSHDLSNLLVR